MPVPICVIYSIRVPVPGRSGYYMLAEELILHFLPMVFDKYRVQEKSLIRITRNADIDADSIYDEDLNYREHMEEVVRQRRKLSPVRLEMTRTLDTGIIDRLCRVLELSENQELFEDVETVVWRDEVPEKDE